VELADRNVVITGAASGIGRALAERFAAERPKALILADLDGEAVEAVAREVGGVGVRTDVGREQDILALVDRAREAGGQVDLFFSNAGIPGPGGGPEAPDPDWDRAWRVNVMAHVWAARAVLPEMIERGEGYLASTASAAGLLTQAGAMVYSVTKHASVAVAEWLAITYADAGIKVSCLCPLGVRTPMLDDALEDTVGGAALMRDELLEPAEVAEVVVAGLRDERFLILPHPQVAKYTAFKGGDNERWLAGMRRMVRQARQRGAGERDAAGPGGAAG
jgi:NAD(P)-dependent dehydrogenase (short-subunit alcohol dehydrogenase family)